MGDMMKYIVDRIEGNYAVCEKDGEMINLSLKELPEVHEGDVLLFQDGEYHIDGKAKEDRMQEILKKMDDVWEN